MANPLSNEKEVFKQIKQKKMTIDPVVWEVITHYIGNDVHAIQFIAGNYVVGDEPEDIPAEDGQKILDRCDEIRKFLIKLREATKSS